MKPTTKNLLSCIAVTTVFFCINLIGIITHESYSDEANQWQIAKSVSLTELPAILKTEGHPPLWYLILMPLAKLGLPYITANIVALLIVTTAVWLLYRRAPFPKTAKLLIIFSGCFMYFLPVIARNYCLVALGITLVGCTYKDRIKKPLRYTATLALLLQSHLLVAGFVGAAVIIFLYELTKRKIRPKTIITSSAIILASLLPIVITLTGSLSSHGYLDSGIERDRPFIQKIPEYLHSLNESLIVTPNLPIVELILILFTTYILLRHTKQGIIFLVGIGFSIFILPTIYSLYKYQQDIIIVLFMVLVAWMSMNDSAKHTKLEHQILRILRNFWQLLKKVELLKILTISCEKLSAAALSILKKLNYYSGKHLLVAPLLAALLCYLTIPKMALSMSSDFGNEFSLSKTTAEYVNQNLPENTTLFTSDGHIAALAIVPYLDTKHSIWDAVKNAPLSYMIFDHASTNRLTATDLGERTPSEPFYFLDGGCSVDYIRLESMNQNVRRLFPQKNLTLIQQFYTLGKTTYKGNMCGENYYAIYKVE